MLKRVASGSDSGGMGWLARKLEDVRSERVIPLASAPVEVQVMGRGTLDVLRARNVSVTGLGVYVDHGFSGLDFADDVEMIVKLPGVPPFLALGQIRHVTRAESAEGDGENHFGLVLTSLSDRNREALLHYVRSRIG